MVKIQNSDKNRLMKAGAELRQDHIRGCGKRKKGYYLVSMGSMHACGKMPLELSCCPACGEGIRQSRAPRWMNPALLFRGLTCRDPDECTFCPLSDSNIERIGKALSIWVGKKFYPTIADFMAEANKLGISRRLNAVPREFVIGESYVMLCHPDTVPTDDPEVWKPGAFYFFKPQAVEYVCDGTETDKDIKKLKAKGITPVVVEMVGENMEMEL